MKRIKALSALIALILCTTIGSVYATWHYAMGNDIADVYTESKVSISNTTSLGALGSFTVTSNLILEVDQKNQTPGSYDYTAVLRFGVNNVDPTAGDPFAPEHDLYVKIVFTPAATAVIPEGGVPAWFTFGTTTAMQYKMDAAGNYDANGTAKDIFVFDQDAINATMTNGKIVWQKQADGTYLFTLNREQLQSIIKLNGDFVLDSKVEHDAFANALVGNIKITVTDGNTTQA